MYDRSKYCLCLGAHRCRAMTPVSVYNESFDSITLLTTHAHKVLRPSHQVEAVPSQIAAPTYKIVPAGVSMYRCCTLQVLLHISQR